jgi:short-subunit dehydrogenase
MDNDIRIAMLTGASRGIGPYIARSLARAGYGLVLAGRSQPELDAVAREIAAAETPALAVPTDVTDPGSLDRLVEATEHEFGRVDVLVNNAGGDPQREFTELTWRENLQILELNLLAPVQLTHRLLPGMLQRGRGHIVNISSIAGRVGFPYAEAYAAAKDGLIGFTRVLRGDYRSRGVSASALLLGAIRDAGQGQRTSDELGLKLPRLGTSPASQVGDAVVSAIREDRPEVVVMPGPGRLLIALTDLFPSIGPALNDRAGARATMRRVIAARRSAPGDPKGDGAGPGVAAELLVDAVQVRAHGVGREVEPGADLLVRQSQRNQVDDLFLTRR